MREERLVGVLGIEAGVMVSFARLPGRTAVLGAPGPLPVSGPGLGFHKHMFPLIDIKGQARSFIGRGK